MIENEFKGAATEGFGRVQDAAGGLISPLASASASACCWAS
jgi:hypothetical protein